MFSRSRQRLAAVLGLGLAVAGLQLVATPAAQASVSSKISTFPYTQDWSGLTSTSTWADFPGVEGFTTGATIAASNQPNSTDVGTLTAEGTLTSALALQSGTTAPNTVTAGGVLGFYAVPDKTVALSATGSITTPLLVFHLDTTGQTGIQVAYDIQDLDSSADDQPTRVALQYRAGTSGAYTNVPAAYVTDATVASNTTVTETAVSATLPAAAEGQVDLYLRVITLDNASGSNEHIGIDNVSITTVPGDPEPASLEATSPGEKTGKVGQPVTGFSLAATGGTAPYTWSATGLPPGVEVAPNGAVSGTPTTAGPYEVTATATDSAAPTPATDDVTFTYTIAEPDPVRTIAEIQGTGATSPYAGTTQTTRGVVTALYPTGGLNGMFIQTPGADTDGASDGLFVYGGSSFANIPGTVAIGDSVEIVGAVSEFSGSTQITPAAPSAVTELETSLGTAIARAIAYPTTEVAREAHEGELLAPTDTFTVSNSYGTNQYAEIGLATGDTPLRQPTEFVRDDDGPGLAEIKADNAARGVTLDDAATLNFLTNGSDNQDIPLPWLSKTNVVRVGAEATFHEPVVLEYRNSIWKFQPTERVTGAGTDVVTFEDTRTPNAAPTAVGGDLKIATFNVLNYFNTTGQQFVTNGGTCTYYNDRDGNPIGSNSCTPNGPRGAATTVSFERQQGKIVNAINTLGADIVGLEEMENSVKLLTETNRDDALAALVTALNTATGAETWDYVHSPAESTVSTAVSEQDVIRPAFIFRKATVSPVGQSDILFGTTEFTNAREPLAQAFKPKGALDSAAFAVIVNHFKSKGDSDPAATGDNANSVDVGAFNGDRTRQATKLAEFADQFAEARGIEAVFLAGDFNSYTNEDPMHVLYEAGYEAVESDTAGEESYSFSGLSGSLDHVLGNAAAMDMVTGADIWDINAAESVAYQYSRFNYNATEFFEAGNPFAASDHNPGIVGIDVPDFGTAYTPVQIIATNDFHGRLLADGANAAGASVLSGAVKELRSENPNTVFAAAGDLIGASTFESFIQKDVPTIDALNEAGLQVSAAGNHEFDAGYDDLVNRVQDRANWEYIAANVVEPAGQNKLAETWTQTFGTGESAIKVGFVGAVTEDLPALVSPAGIQGVTVTDIVDATNAAATSLKAGGADLVVLLVHEGAPSTTCASMTDPTTTWGNIVTGVSADVDAIVSGHTHLAYNCSFPVTAWADRAVKDRPVVSAGQYGTNLNQLVFTFDNVTGQLVTKSQDVIGLVGTGYPVDPATKTIVDQAAAQAEVLGAQELGQLGGGFNRAKLSTAAENRGGESTLGNLVAEVQRWATRKPESGSAQIAFMNPGGLRADMVGSGDGAFPRVLTYKQAAVVQPFANTLVNMDLTGANIKLALEQQWQRDGSNNVPSRPFLRLGASEGFTYTFDKTLPEGSRITGMWLNGKAIDPAKNYSVTVNSFLSSGGDNFRAFNNGTGKADTGKVDLQAMVDYMDAKTASAPLAVNSSQRAVGVTFPAEAPASYAPGDHVTFGVSSWTMSAAADAKDTEVQVKLGGEVLGSFPLDNTIGTAVFDDYGTAAVDVVVPASAVDGARRLRLVGATTGSSIVVPIQVSDGDSIEEVQILATNDFHGRLLADGANAAGAAVLSGAVKQLREDNPNTVFAAAGDLIGASTFESFIQKDVPTIDALNEAGLQVSAAGNHEFDAGYEDLVGRVQDRADWEYIAANVVEPAGRDDLAETWTQTFGTVQVGFVGAVTEDLPSLVSPAGITGVSVTDVVDATNAAATQLKTGGADLVVLLVHEGAPSTACNTMTDPATTWGNIVTGVGPQVDAIVSGHTHLAYNCSFPVTAWADRAVTERPVVSAGQYGTNLNKLVFSVDSATGQVVTKSQALLPLVGTGYPADPATKAIVDDAVAEAEVLGAQQLGELGGAFNRAKLSSAAENRGGESTLGNLVAEVQRWATRNPESGSAQIAFMNPGGLRADMAGGITGETSYPKTLTYKQAAVVQPFANTLVNMDLTGANIKLALEQQWQRDGSNNVPSRPFLRLGASEGFTYTFDAAKPEGERITGMWLNGTPIDLAATYSVTVNSFLASGGDNFRAFNNGTGKADTGKVDLQAMVDYMDEMTAAAPLPVDSSQRAVGVSFPVGAPASYTAGDHVTFGVSSWTMSNPTDVTDTNVDVKLGDTVLGSFPLDNTIGTAVFDDYGTAAVDVVVPEGAVAGPTELTLVGQQTGTVIPVSIQVDPTTTVTVGDVAISYGKAAPVTVTVNPEATGSVDIKSGGTTLGSAPVSGGVATVTLPAKSLLPGASTLTASYSGDSAFKPASASFVATVAKATSRTTAKVKPAKIKSGKTRPTVTITVVGANGVLATGPVQFTVTGRSTKTVTLKNGKATVKLAKFNGTGKKTVRVAYAGSSLVQRSTDTVSFIVRKK